MYFLKVVFPLWLFSIDIFGIGRLFIDTLSSVDFMEDFISWDFEDLFTFSTLNV